MPVPTSQKDRQISFGLWSGGALQSNYVMNIRPEELTVDEPTRVNVTQTLGGAWADIFGLGIATVNIQGHTGWRGSSGSSFGTSFDLGKDGEAYFHALRNDIFRGFFAAGTAAIAAGRNPGVIECLFTDTLNSMVMSVVPTNFQLRRHKSRPLLLQYKMTLTVLDYLHNNRNAA